MYTVYIDRSLVNVLRYILIIIDDGMLILLYPCVCSVGWINDVTKGKTVKIGR